MTKYVPLKLAVVIVALAIALSAVLLPKGSVAQVSAVSTCAPTQLQVAFGRMNGTAGTFVYPLIITNTGAACTLTLYPPILQPVKGTSAVGDPTSNGVINYMAPLSHLSHGQSLSSPVGFTDTGNYSSSTCQPAVITGVLATFANVTNRFVPLNKMTVCTALVSVHVQKAVLGAPPAQTCTATQLNVSLGRMNGTAGFFYPLIITNTGAACTLSLYPPILQPVKGNTPVGGPTSNGVITYMAILRRLGHGQSLSSLVGFTGTGNYSSSTCKPAAITGVLATVANVTNRFVPLSKMTVCTALVSVHVQSVVAGTQNS